MARAAKTRRPPAKNTVRKRAATPSSAPSGARDADIRRFGALAVLGAWTIVVPYLGRAIGLVVDVASSVEIVDHVVPGTLVAAVATYLAVNAYRDTLPKLARPVGGGICFLAGFWVLATHVPLIVQAFQGKAAWGSTLWHASTAVPLVALSLWTVLEDW
jgi:hypothetical protein